jgi:hypothetical protein
MPLLLEIELINESSAGLAGLTYIGFVNSSEGGDIYCVWILNDVYLVVVDDRKGGGDTC